RERRKSLPEDHAERQFFDTVEDLPRAVLALARNAILEAGNPHRGNDNPAATNASEPMPIAEASKPQEVEPDVQMVTPTKPAEYLRNWPDILKALNLKNNKKADKHFVRTRNDQHSGPIKIGKPGEPPFAER